MKHSADFINKIDQIGGIPANDILLSADVVGLQLSIPHKAGLKTLKNAMEKREQGHIDTKKKISMSESVLKSNFV